MKIWCHGDRETNRIWFYIGDWCLGFELSLGRWWNFGGELSFGSRGGEILVSASAGIPLIRIYANLKAPWAIMKHIFGWDRVIGLNVWGDAIHYQFWSDEWNEKTPRWRSGFFRPVDLIFGKMKWVKDETISEGKTVISMPEGSYVAHYKVFETTWSRTRFFKRSIIRATLSVENGIPFRGKWGDDAVYSLTTPTVCLQEAIQRYHDDIMAYRKERGWSDDDLRRFQEAVSRGRDAHSGTGGRDIPSQSNLSIL